MTISEIFWICVLSSNHEVHADFSLVADLRCSKLNNKKTGGMMLMIHT